jgi:hypothetical protein
MIDTGSCEPLVVVLSMVSNINPISLSFIFFINKIKDLSIEHRYAPGSSDFNKQVKFDFGYNVLHGSRTILINLFSEMAIFVVLMIIYVSLLLGGTRGISVFYRQIFDFVNEKNKT